MQWKSTEERECGASQERLFNIMLLHPSALDQLCILHFITSFVCGWEKFRGSPSFVKRSPPTNQQMTLNVYFIMMQVLVWFATTATYVWQRCVKTEIRSAVCNLVVITWNSSDQNSSACERRCSHAIHPLSSAYLGSVCSGSRLTSSRSPSPLSSSQTRWDL